jgi:hypothetical protein
VLALAQGFGFNPENRKKEKEGKITWQLKTILFLESGSQLK